MWLMWGPILRLLPDRAAGDIVKDYYLPDQFAYMSVARNVQEGLPAFVEPFTVTGSSIYPSTYYWFLGKVSDLGSMTVFGAWNAVGMLVTLGILAMSTAWALWAAPRTRAWVLAPVPLMIGTLEWYAGDDRWFTGYGDHAVLWPAYGTLFSPGAEVFSLVAGGLAVLLLVVALPAGGRRRLVAGAGSGALLGLALLGHTYVAMFTLTAIVATATAYEWLRRPLGRSHAILVGVLGVLLVASGLSSGSGSVARLGAVLAVPVVWLALRRDWRRDQGPTALALAGGALVVGSPLLVRIAVQVADPDSFFYLRQELAETRHLSLPLGAVLLQFLPLWILAGTALTLLVRRARTARDDAVLTALTGLLVTSSCSRSTGCGASTPSRTASCRTERSSWRSSRCRPWRRRCWRRGRLPRGRGSPPSACWPSAPSPSRRHSSSRATRRTSCSRSSRDASPTRRSRM